MTHISNSKGHVSRRIPYLCRTTQYVNRPSKQYMLTWIRRGRAVIDMHLPQNHWNLYAPSTTISHSSTHF